MPWSQLPASVTNHRLSQHHIFHADKSKSKTPPALDSAEGILTCDYSVILGSLAGCQESSRESLLSMLFVIWLSLWNCWLVPLPSSLTSLVFCCQTCLSCTCYMIFPMLIYSRFQINERGGDREEGERGRNPGYFLCYPPISLWLSPVSPLSLDWTSLTVSAASPIINIADLSKAAEKVPFSGHLCSRGG